MKKLVLFDIDFTLMDVKGAHKRALVKAFKQVLNIDYDLNKWKFCGNTDLNIIHCIMDEFKIKKDPKKIDEIIKSVVSEFKRESLRDAILLESVVDILRQISKRKDIILGLVTGNIEEIANVKLNHFKIGEYFVVGGFGDISRIRSDLIEKAVNEAGKKFGKINKRNVFIIGDTSYDIIAAQESGVKVIAVATGNYSPEELTKLKPDYLFNNLKDTKKIIEVITNG